MTIKKIKDNFFCIYRFAVLTVSGVDAKNFLQNLITNDINILEKKNFLRTIIANPSGKVSFDVFIKKGKQQYLIFHEIRDKQRIKQHFDFFHILEKLEFEESEQDLFYLLFLQENYKEQLLEEETIILKNDFFALLEAKSITNFTKKLLDKKYQQITSQELDNIRPICFLVKSGIDFTQKNLPQEAGFRNIISFKKGCFVGQEVIARLEYKGKVTKILSQILSQKKLKQGDIIVVNQKQDLGKITSSCDIPYKNNFYSLGYIKTSLIKEVQSEENNTYSSDGILIHKIIPLEKS